MTQAAELWDGLTVLTKRVKALESDNAKLSRLAKDVEALKAWQEAMELDAAHAMAKFRKASVLMDPALAETMQAAGLD